jgi:hypothetical protein
MPPPDKENDDDPQDGEQRRTATLAGIALVLLLLVIGVFLAHKLAEMSRVQDCVMSGRTNCAPIEPSGSGG